MGAPKKYSKKKLQAAVQAYFDSITREVTLTEPKDNGKRNSYGHVIYDHEPVKNKLGEVVKITEYLVPPTLGGLCIHLGIVSSTWSRWSNANEYPEYEDIVAGVKERMLTWRREQVLLRKDVKGLIWDMETNYGAGKTQDEDQRKPDMIVEGLPEEFRA